MTATMTAAQHRQAWRPSEREFQQCVIDAARTFGWLVYHTLTSRGSASGFPDLVIIKPGHLIIWELKTSRGRVRPEQLTWIAHFATIPNITCGILRPDDWDQALAILAGESATIENQ